MDRLPRTSSSLACLFAALVALLAPSASAKTLPGDWVEVRSENFVVVSNAGQKRARNVAVHFELIRALMAREMPKFAEAHGPPLMVLAARDTRTMKRILPVFWKDRRRSKPAGVFSSNPARQLAVVQVNLLERGSFAVVYHEYFHFLAARAELKMPPWLSEGLAEYWGSGTRLTPEFAEVARPPIHGIRFLVDFGFLPLEELFAADHGSLLYRNRAKKYRFYAQSWILVHMMLLGDDTGELRQQLVSYFGLLAEGIDSLEAAERAFGDLRELERRHHAYSRLPTFSFAKLPLPPEPEADTLRLRKMSRGEAAGIVAHRFSRSLGSENLEALLEQAEAESQAGNRATTLEARGLFHLHRAEASEGIAAFEKAVALADASPVAPYGLAILRLHQARRARQLDRELLVDIEALLQRALEKNPDFAPAHARLSDLYRRLDGDPERALAAIRKAVEIEPHYPQYRFG
ncbi:MAG: hypothetical protein MI919_27520, partial [Holophagales bacterium]|nr:hypothetical protein [Holophagales bacterium]